MWCCAHVSVLLSKISRFAGVMMLEREDFLSSIFRLFLDEGDAG